MFICQTPHQYCTGSKAGQTSAGLREIKIHGSGVEANRCYANYLIKHHGYIRIPFNNRELHHPDGRPALILSKRHKPDLRKGKRGGKDAKGNRVMPSRETGGIIV